ncbi:MAG: cytochrome b/b6 domain-containing protein [Paracoccaceae bacterium]
MVEKTGYSGAQIGLHWLIALGVLANYLFSEGMGKALHQKMEGAEITVAIAPLHVWLGVAVLVLVALRLVLRLLQGAPAQEPGAQGRLAAGMHGLLYLLMLAMPLGGALTWFGGIEALGDGHALAANLLMLLAGLHAVMGLYHHYVLKDGTLKRMMRPA